MSISYMVQMFGYLLCILQLKNALMGANTIILVLSQWSTMQGLKLDFLSYAFIVLFLAHILYTDQTSLKPTAVLALM